MKPKIGKIRKRDGRVVKFDTEKITKAIWAAAQSVGGKDRTIAEKLTKDVVRVLERKYDDGGIPGVEHIQDMVEKVLIENGHAKTAKAYILYREQHKNLREVTKLLRDITIVDDYIEELDWRVRENSNMTYSLQGLNVHITSKVISNYWLNSVYPKEIRDAHINGEFHIHDLGTLGPYTYFGKESVIAKLDGRLLVTSFQRLYESLKEKENLLSKADDACAKYPKNLMVLDGKGWTEATRLVKKAKKKKMQFIKNEGGRSVIVTEDHPMILNEQGETKAAKLVKTEEDKTLTVDLKKLMTKEKLFHKETIFLAEELLNRGIDDFWIDGMPLEEYSKYSKDFKANVMVSANNNANVLPNRVKLTENLGYLVGYCLAEGSVDAHKLKIKQKKTPSNKKAFERLKNAAHGLGCRLYARDKNGITTLDIANTTFVKYLIKEVFTCGGISKDKMLPEDILSYNKRFVKGIVAGVIDGDGSINSSRTSIDVRTSSRTMLEQMATVLNLLGFVARDRNIEGVGTEREFKGRRIVQNYPLFGISFRTLKGKSLPSFKYNSAGLSGKAWRAECAGWHKILNNESTKTTDKYIYDITTNSSTLVVNGMWNHNCVGWDLEDLLMSGFRGVRGKIESKPAKHFDVALMQIVNFMYTLQGEAAGAQALSNFDTLLAPFIRVDKLKYEQVKQSMQKFLFNMNVPTRVGFQTPFSNLTMDLTPPSFMKGQPVIIGGKPQDTTYGDYQEEMDMLNRAFAETMLAGDASSRPFTFPIPTYNVTKDFPWDKKELQAIWEMTAKYGIPYFANFINSDMKPDDVRSMCCRLRIDNRELRKRGGGLFGSHPLTGCYDEKTEILTEGGWKFFKDLTKKDAVFTLNEKNEIEIHKPKRLFKYDHDGQMYNFRTKSLDLLVTPNHRMVVDQTYKNKRKFVEAKDFDVNNHRIPKQGIWDGEDKEWFVLPGIEFIKYGRQGRTPYSVIRDSLRVKMGDWLRFFGFWLAEGCTDNEKIAKRHGYRVTVVQINKRKRKEFREILDELPFNYYEENHSFIICNKQLWTYLRQFGNKYTKFVPPEIKGLSKRQLKILFDWMVKGDGHIRKTNGQINYWTSSKKLADDLQEIIMKLGWLGTLTARKGRVSEIKGRKINAGICYTIGVQKTRHYRLREGSIKKVDYKGKVYCCEVENNTLFVRRNGRVCWCGNSVGVVTLNLPRIAYEAENEEDFFDILERRMELAKESLIIKREILEKFTDSGLYPYSRFYLRGIKKSQGSFWKNHFSTIGIIGMNDALLNFSGHDMTQPQGRDFAIKVLDFMRKKLMEFQDETGDIFNLEATPAEGTSYRLARIDMKLFPKMKVYNLEKYGKKDAKPYYTNSTQLPVGFTDDIFQALELQDPLQVKYTGGTVLHGFIGEKLPSAEATKALVKTIAENFHLPYFTLTPTFSICPFHGYLEGEHEYCPKCDEESGFVKIAKGGK